MIRAWRICKRRWASAAFSGDGAAEYPGRWNLPGQRAVYCADSKALASLEVMANTARKRTLAKAKFVAIPVEIPDGLIFSPRKLPRNWKASPPTEEVRQHGAALLQDRAVVRVPSVVVDDEFCYVINPRHPDFGKLKIGRPEPFSFDPRILTSSEEP